MALKANIFELSNVSPELPELDRSAHGAPYQDKEPLKNIMKADTQDFQINFRVVSLFDGHNFSLIPMFKINQAEKTYC